MKNYDISLSSIERVSNKTNSAYSVTLITITCPNCGVSMTIEDFNVKIPFESSLASTIEKIENRYVITELNYSVPWQYSIAISLLLKHNCK